MQEIAKFRGMKSYDYLLELMAYLNHKPWDKIDLMEFARSDKTGLVKKAYKCACGMHRGTLRRDLQFARSHPAKVAKILIYFGVTDPVIIAAALLHDTSEDNHDEVLKIIKKSYPRSVYSVVYGVSRTKKMSKDKHFSLIFRTFKRIILKLADRLHNIRNMTKNLYFNEDFTRNRLINYKKETIQRIYPLGIKIVASDYMYAECGQEIYIKIKDAIFIANQVLTIPKKDVVRYQMSRKQYKLF